MDVAAKEVTQYFCAVDVRVLSSDFVAYAAYDQRIFLAGKRTLDPRVDIVYVDELGQFIVADIAVKSRSFRIVVFYASYYHFSPLFNFLFFRDECIRGSF